MAFGLSPYNIKRTSLQRPVKGQNESFLYFSICSCSNIVNYAHPPLLVGRSVVMARLCSFVRNNGCKFEQDNPMVVGLKLSSSARLYPVMAVELHL